METAYLQALQSELEWVTDPQRIAEINAEIHRVLGGKPKNRRNIPAAESR